MSLQPGARLGPYEVVSPLGEGGMGVVYRARDTRLDRDVALKVLPDLFTHDAERLARFAREAKTLASLNHPHIAHVYGVEESGSTHALVMELVDGEDLSEKIKSGAGIPLEEVLAIAKQVAEALEAAHEQGIIHRDLKPANIKVRPDGTVKVLDFGLAKAVDQASSPKSQAPEAAHSPTITSPAMTQRGVILGTAAYMAPEQAKGKFVDKRADIWAFGVVLYEMLTRRRAFDGEDTQDVLVAVLSKNIDFSALPSGTPAPVGQLLRRCLERDPRRRLRDIGEARLVIEDVIAGTATSEETGRTESISAPRSRRTTIAWLVVSLAASLAAAFLGYRANAGARDPRPPQHLAIHLAANQELSLGFDASMTFSPDGSTVVFLGIDNGRPILLQRRLDGDTAVAIAGTEQGISPTFSPDGRWIAFMSNRTRLVKVPADGGRPIAVGETTGSGGSTWLADNTIVYTPMYSEGLFRIGADGGTPERLTTPDRAMGELGHFYPDRLPGDGQVLFTAFRTPVDQSRIGVLDLATRQVRWIIDGGFFARYVDTGHILYAKDQRLYAIPFDTATLATTGPAVPVLEDLFVSQTGGFAPFAVSRHGTLAYVTNSLGSPLNELVWLDRNGRATAAVGERRHFFSVSLSPDDTQIALTILDNDFDLWTYSFPRRIFSRITSSPTTEFQPVWSRDSRELFYVRDRPPFELYRVAVAAPDSGRPIWKGQPDLDLISIAPAPDGRTIMYTITEAGTGANVYARSLDGAAAAQPIATTRASEANSTFSPDGKFVAYASDQTGRPEVYVQHYPGPVERVQVSTEGGWEPLWATNGELFYRHDNDMWVVKARPGARLEFEAPKKLFEFRMANGETGLRAYAVTADAARILAIATPEANRTRQIEVITDWTTTLRTPRR